MLYFDNIYLSGDSIDPPPSESAGIYSESHTDPMFSYSMIVNSADWSGNSAAADELSTAVTPVDGTYVLAVEFTDFSMGWGGIAFDFGSQDMSAYSTFVFNVDTSDLGDMTQMGIKFEDNSGGNTEVNITSYTPVITANWAKYEIPMAHFGGVNLTDVKYLGLWNPSDSGSNLLFGTLYFDDIYLINR